MKIFNSIVWSVALLGAAMIFCGCESIRNDPVIHVDLNGIKWHFTAPLSWQGQALENRVNVSYRGQNIAINMRQASSVKDNEAYHNRMLETYSKIVKDLHLLLQGRSPVAFGIWRGERFVAVNRITRTILICYVLHYDRYTLTISTRGREHNIDSIGTIIDTIVFDDTTAPAMIDEVVGFFDFLIDRPVDSAGPKSEVKASEVKPAEQKK